MGSVIRVCGNVHVTAADGEKRQAAEWVGTGGRAHKLLGAAVTATPHPVGVVVRVHAKSMKEPWCLAASNAQASTAGIVNLYSKRWTIEPRFRDTRDLRSGWTATFKVNTVKRRTHSLFRQGCMLYVLIPNMPDTRLRPLTKRSAEMIQQKSVSAVVFTLR